MQFTLENCEEITLPEPFCFLHDGNALLLGFIVPETVKGSPKDYSRNEFIKRLSWPDITRIEFANQKYVFQSSAEIEATEGSYVLADMMFLAFGDMASLLLAYNDDEGIQSDPDWKKGFYGAISVRAKNEVLDDDEEPDEEPDGKSEEEPDEEPLSSGAKLCAMEIGTLVTIANLLATHFGMTDKPKGGWAALGGNPYEAHMKTLEEMIQDI